MSKILYDFRSDTVTRPSAGMRAAMAEAEVGDDVYREDGPTLALENRVAELTGKEAGVYFPSGTQSNLAALMVHCERGDEYIAGQNAHLYRFEAGGGAVLGSIQPQPIENATDGTLPLEKIAAAIKLDDIHFARTRLLALENTIGGRVLPQVYVEEATALARQHKLSTHLDGARVFNAAVASNRSAAELTKPFDTVSVCLSKGLGAPVGSVLVGSSEHIEKARRLRKMLGGGMRQIGMLTAAGLYALEHNIDRLADDHARARRLADGLAQFQAIRVEMPQSNIVFTRADTAIADAFAAHLKEAGVGVAGRYGEQRWVTHLDLDDAAIDAALSAVEDFFSR